MAPNKLDDSYDMKGAKAAVEHYATLRSNEKTKLRQLSSFAVNLPPIYDVIKSQGHTSAVRLGLHNDENSDMDEAVLRYQGIIVDHALPPVKRMQRIDDKTGRYLTQSIAVTGFGCASFQQAYQGMFVIAEHLGRHLPNDAAPLWKVQKYHGMDTIHGSNRYLTWKGASEVAASIPFAPHVDPFQTLSEIAGDKYIHTEENHVEYMVCSGLESDKATYRPKDPATFAVGDIVEVQVSFAAFSTRGRNGNALELVLRGVTLLTDRFSRAARITQMMSETSKPAASAPALKRKTRYEDDDVEVDSTGEQLKRMTICKRG